MISNVITNEEPTLIGLGLKKSGKKAELVDRILGREVVVEKKKKPQWRNSKARALLEKMLMDKHSPVHKMKWWHVPSTLFVRRCYHNEEIQSCLFSRKSRIDHSN